MESAAPIKDPKNIKCLQAFLECKDLVDWIRDNVNSESNNLISVYNLCHFGIVLQESGEVQNQQR